MAELYEDENVFDAHPQLAVLAPLVELAKNVHWFRAVGEPLKPEARELAHNYCDGLGYPDAEPALLGLWADAAAAAETLDFNSPSWESEEQLRAHLTQEALENVDEETLEFIFTHIANEVLAAAAEGAEEIADYLRIDDMDFVTAAAGAAVQAVHLAALVLIAGEETDHPFAQKFHLFEAGHWPLGITGSTFNIF